VWCAYRANVAAVAATLRRDYGEDSVVEFHGGVEQRARQEAVARFESGRAHFMVATPHSGGRGNTWNAGKTVVFYSNPWDLELRLNAEDRNHRIGQTVSVNYVDIVVPNSLDERIVRSLREKIDISSKINGDSWKEWVI
jgi:SNF2 family DNA or RNA helicase